MKCCLICDYVYEPKQDSPDTRFCSEDCLSIYNEREIKAKELKGDKE